MRYRKPLLTELFTESHLQPNSFGPEKIMDFAHGLREVGFSRLEFTTVQRIEPNQLMSILPRIRCWTPDRKNLIQLSPDQVVINCVGDYLGWNNFCQLFGNTLARFEQLAGQININSIGLNAIDKIDLVDPQNFRLGDYLHCGGSVIPEIYENTSVAADISLGNGLVAVDGFNRVIKVSVRPSQKHVGIQMHSLFHGVLKSDISRDKLIEQLHDEANEYFEAMITDKTRNEVMEGVVKE
jgi:uncharacterized protein (TIGR04255 family)